MAFIEDAAVFFDDFADDATLITSTENLSVKAIIDDDVEIVSNDVVNLEKTVTLQRVNYTVGDKLIIGADTWTMGRTVKKDNLLMTVIVE